MVAAESNVEKLSGAIILVVEDNALQRLDLVDTIEEAGYVALEAVNADQAISILESRTDIRLMFTDIDMPGSRDGLRLAAFVKDRWPPIEIIVTTAGKRPDSSLMPERAIFVPKPFTSSDAVQAIHGLLDAS